MCTSALCGMYDKCALLRWGWGEDKEKHLLCTKVWYAGFYRECCTDISYREQKSFVCCSFCFKPIDNILCLIGFMSNFIICILVYLQYYVWWLYIQITMEPYSNLGWRGPLEVTWYHHLSKYGELQRSNSELNWGPQGLVELNFEYFFHSSLGNLIQCWTILRGRFFSLYLSQIWLFAICACCLSSAMHFWGDLSPSYL